jgi:hypothetical protein
MTSLREYPSSLTITTATIASGQTTSAAVDLSGTTLVGLQMPASFTGTSVTFQVATSAAGTYQSMTSSTGSALTFTVAGGKYVAANPTDFAGVQYFKLISGSSEGADRIIELVTRPV